MTTGLCVLPSDAIYLVPASKRTLDVRIEGLPWLFGFDFDQPRIVPDWRPFEGS
jgi:hypothetical protein